jgi:cytochrome d ubiquinol oxidase subunit I
VWQFDRKLYSAIGGKGEGSAALAWLDVTALAADAAAAVDARVAPFRVPRCAVVAIVVLLFRGAAVAPCRRPAALPFERALPRGARASPVWGDDSRRCVRLGGSGPVDAERPRGSHGTTTMSDTHLLGVIGPILAVDPVPWARAQMAVTLATHIILVPLGVSWAFMAMIANYRGIKHGDEDALQLAQRWSKYMAVTFAVGAVTGTVLTFEFGLLWPTFMGQWGAAFGVPFAFEGLFFFTEAIFIAIYIYGWRRLKPWPHFWTAIPLVLTGILGSVSVVAANAWMNEPSGFTLDSAGKIVNVDPWAVIFNDAMPLMAAHMVVAAYVVGGFLISSVYAYAMLKGRRDRYHRVGFLIAFSVAAVAAPIQILVGDSLARWVFNNEAEKFAAIELVPDTTSDVPETLLGHLNSDGTVTGGIAIPGLASWLSDPTTGTATVVQGLNSQPPEDQPTIREVNVVHLAWDVMVGLGSLLALLSVWYGLCWLFRRDMPKSKWFLRFASAAGIASIVTLESGWVVSEVGRQPWIVHGLMKVEDAATANSGVWVTFLVVTTLYIGLAITTILILRKMSARFRGPGIAEHDVPYGPRDPDLAETAPDDEMAQV